MLSFAFVISFSSLGKKYDATYSHVPAADGGAAPLGGSSGAPKGHTEPFGKQ